MDAVFMLAAAIVLVTSTYFTVTIEASKDSSGAFRYSALTFLLFTAICKAGIAGSVLFVQWAKRRRTHPQHTESSASGSDVGSRDVFRRRTFLLFLGSAGLYAVNDVLVFVVMSFFDNTDYSILVTGKIVVVALLTRTVLQRKLTDVQYASFVVLSIGVAVNQYDFCPEAGAPSKLGGYLVVVGAEIVGGCAGILNEYLMRKAPEQTLQFQNFNLYLASILLYIPVIAVWDGPSWVRHGPFYGFTPIVWTMLPVNAVRGVAISFVYHESTNMTKIFIISCAILANGVCGDLLFGTKLTAQFFFSFILISVALYLYGSQKSSQVRPLAPPHGTSPSSSDTKHGNYDRVDNDDEFTIDLELELQEERGWNNTG